MGSVPGVADRLTVVELQRAETCFAGAWQVAEQLAECARRHRRVAAVLEVDRYSHAYRSGVPIDPGIRDVREVLVRFDAELADPGRLAAEPLAIDIAELADRYIVSTPSASQDWINATVVGWIQSLRCPHADVRRAGPIGYGAAADSRCPSTIVRGCR